MSAPFTDVELSLILGERDANGLGRWGKCGGLGKMCLVQAANMGPLSLHQHRKAEVLAKIMVGFDREYLELWSDEFLLYKIEKWANAR